MSKILITIAALGAAMVIAIDKAKDQPELKKHLEDLNESLTAFGMVHNGLVNDLKQASETINELKAELDTAIAVNEEKSEVPIIKIKNTKYKVMHGSHPHTVQEIVNNPDLADEILKIKGQNVIVKLNP